jgi:hypothetical protein
MDSLILEVFTAIFTIWLEILQIAFVAASYMVDPLTNPISFALVTSLVAGALMVAGLTVPCTIAAALVRFAFSRAPRAEGP